MFARSFPPKPNNLFRDHRLQPKLFNLTRLMTLVATITLAATVLFQTPSDFRMAVCIIVSLAATALAARGLLIGKPVWTLLFLGVLGAFTPFHPAQFSHLLLSVLDMATLALLAATPLVLGKSASPFVLKHLQERL